MTKRHWYNNGSIEKVFYETTVPEGFKLGKLPRSAEHCKNISKSKLGHKTSEETKNKISKTLTGTKLNKETCAKLSKTLGDGRLKGFKCYNNGIITIRLKANEPCPNGFVPGKLPLSAKTKQKISKALVGKKKSDATKEKLRIANSGKKYSQKTLDKRIATKRKNGTLNSSSDEVKFEKALIKLFGMDGYIAQYKDIRYNYNCDFYIPKLDLFIELNHHWTHGKHKFNKNNLEDIKKLKYWRTRSKKSKFYKTAIYVWTELDPKKLKCAEEHNLNYLVSYNQAEMNKIIKSLKKI